MQTTITRWTILGALLAGAIGCSANATYPTNVITETLPASVGVKALPGAGKSAGFGDGKLPSSDPKDIKKLEEAQKHQKKSSPKPD